MSKIRVALRVRPLSDRESNGGFPVVVAVNRNFAYITDIKVPEKPSADSRQRFRQFEFDHSFWLTEKGEDGASQQQVYQEIGPPLEKSILEGYNACLLAYGQSGTGKTHTMLGNKDEPGLIPRLCQSLWEKLKEKHKCPPGSNKPNFRMEVSFMEIYREKVRDLLSPENKALKLREHPQLGPHVQDLTRVEVNEEMGLNHLLWEGERHRAIGTTGSNRRSSRSHAIWTLYLTTRNNGHNSAQTDLITNQVHLVDLAGSERAEFTTTKNLLAEGADINRSLVSLGNVISALAEKAQYVPYRDSALTWLLKDSLGGNATTAIIITASPASCCHAQTLNSLRFAQRARLVENQPKVNASVSISGAIPMMSTFDIKRDISRLANILRSAQSNGGILRGLAPRIGWNRLISAIEGLNPNSAENKNDPKEEDRQTKGQRAASEDATTNTSCSPINLSTKSLTDVMVQADLKYEESASSKPMASNSASVPATPSKVISTEVFIPHSNSIKCLTWEQEEPRIVPKIPQPLTDSEEEYLSPPLTPKINHLKYLLPVHYPQTHNLDHASRISEKIHRSFNYEEPEIFHLFPVDIVDQCAGNHPVVRSKLPTLVKDNEMADISEYACRSRSEELRRVPIHCKSLSCFENCASHMPAVEFYKMQRKTITPLESTDDDEVFLDGEGDIVRNVLRASQYKHSRLALPDSFTSPDDTSIFFPGESILTSTPSVSSTSSYESLKTPGHLRKVRVVQKASSCEFVEDVISEIIEEDPLFENHIATVYNIEENPEDEKSTVEIHECPVYKKALDGFSKSKFRNYFARELYNLDKIGKQIKNLQHMSERYSIVKPYLDQIAELDHGDHSRPDPKIDEAIERCSGWNVDIEFQKVANELSSINKILKTGRVPLPSTGRSEDYSSATNSRTSTTISSESLSARGGCHRSRSDSFASSNMFEPKNSSAKHYLHQNNLNLTSPNHHSHQNTFYPQPFIKGSPRLPPASALSNSCHTFGTLASSTSNSTLNCHSSGVHNSNSSPNLHNLRKSHINTQQHNSNHNPSHWEYHSGTKTGSYYDTMGDQNLPYNNHYTFYPGSYQEQQGPSTPLRNRNEFPWSERDNLNINHSSPNLRRNPMSPQFQSEKTMFQSPHNHHLPMHSFKSPHFPPAKGYTAFSREGSSMAGYTSGTSASRYDNGSLDFCSCQESVNSSVPAGIRSLSRLHSPANTSPPTTSIDFSNSNGTDSSSGYQPLLPTAGKTPLQHKKIRAIRKSNRYD